MNLNDPTGELTAVPQSLAGYQGAASRQAKGKEKIQKRGKGREGEKGEGRGGGRSPLLLNN